MEPPRIDQTLQQNSQEQTLHITTRVADIRLSGVIADSDRQSDSSGTGDDDAADEDEDDVVDDITSPRDSGMNISHFHFYFLGSGVVIFDELHFGAGCKR